MGIFSFLKKKEPAPAPAPSPTPSLRLGTSYVDPITGKGYEVTPTGVKTEVIVPKGGGGGGGYSYVDPTTGKGYEVSPTGVKTEITPVGKIGTTPAAFTGKVETVGEDEVRYYKEGKEVGKLFSVKGQKYAEVSKGVKSAFFQFDTQEGTKREVVELGGELGGARISEYEMIVGSPAQEVDIVGGGISAPLSAIGVWKEPTAEQLKESKFYSEFYGKTKAGDILGTIFKPIGNLFGKGEALIGQIETGLRKEKGTKQETFGLIQTPTKGMYGATSTYSLPEIIEPIEKKGLKFLPEWEFKPEEFAKETYYKEKAGGIFGLKVATGTLALTSGFYGGLKEHPGKAVITTAAFIALPPVLKGGKYLAGVTGATKVISAYPKTTAIIGGGIKYGLGGAYGLSVTGRVIASPGFEKFGTLGEITSTEIIPMAVGLKVGGYGVRRYELSSELKGWTEQLSPAKKVEFLSAMKEAKAYSKFQPGVEEISLARLKLVEKYPKIQEELLSYFKSRRGDVIVGGSIAQQTQMRGVPTKRPGDIDIYVRKMFGEGVMGEKYAKDVRDILRVGGLKGVRASGGKVTIGGEKFAEFHPYESYLKANIEQVSPWYKFAASGLAKTPSGIVVPKLTVQWQRKLIGGYLEQYATGKLRLKDIPATEAIKKSVQMEYVKPISLVSDKRGILGLGEFKPLKYELPKSLRTTEFSFKGEGKGGLGVSDYYSYKPVQEVYPYRKVKKAISEYYASTKPTKALPYSLYLPTTPKLIPPITTKPETTFYPKRISRKYPISNIPYTPIKEPFIIIGGGGEYFPTVTSKKSKDIIMGKIHIALPKGAGIIRAERLFIETPTLGTALGREFGITFKTTELGGISGLGERKYKTKIKLPTTVLKTVQAKEFETFPKLKSYMKSVI